jgi:hypothetical protein
MFFEPCVVFNGWLAGGQLTGELQNYHWEKKHDFHLHGCLQGNRWSKDNGLCISETIPLGISKKQQFINKGSNKVHPQFKHTYLFDTLWYSTFSAYRFRSRQNKDWMGRKITKYLRNTKNFTKILTQHFLTYNWMKNVMIVMKSNIFPTEMVSTTHVSIILEM